MREILFRAKAINRDIGYHRTNYKNGDWVYGLVTKLYDERFDLPAEMTDINGVSGIEVDYKTIGRYTGLKDKNGKRIFEGDIVKCSDIDDYYYPEEKTEFVGTIVFESGAFGIATKDTLPISLENWCENDNFVSFWELEWNEYIYNVEIIGNIHDNPELLR